MGIDYAAPEEVLIRTMNAFCRSILIGLAVLLVSQSLLAQNAELAKEKSAEEAVAKYIREVREKSGLARLHRIKDGHLRADACSRARRSNNSLGQSDGIGPPEKVGTLSVFWYSTLDPDNPPQELAEWAKGPEKKYEQPHRFAVAVCLIKKPDGSEQRYYIDAGTYMSAVKSILNIPTWD